MSKVAANTAFVLADEHPVTVTMQGSVAETVLKLLRRRLGT